MSTDPLTGAGKTDASLKVLGALPIGQPTGAELFGVGSKQGAVSLLVVRAAQHHSLPLNCRWVRGWLGPERLAASEQGVWGEEESPQAWAAAASRLILLQHR